MNGQLTIAAADGLVFGLKADCCTMTVTVAVGKFTARHGEGCCSTWPDDPELRELLVKAIAKVLRHEQERRQ